MIIGIMTVNGFDFHPNGRLREAAESRGHEILLINPYTLVCSLKAGRPELSMEGRIPDVIMPRQGSPMGEYGLVVLGHFARMGIPLVNGIEGVGMARNQYLTLQALSRSGIPIPDTCFITRKSSFSRAVKEVGGFPVVAKQVDGMGGEGVTKIETLAQGEKFLDHHLLPAKGMLVQQFISPQGRRDVRMLVIGKAVAGAMVLVPPPGEFRANIHQNGRASALDPPDHWIKLGLASAHACSLEIAGVDMIVDPTGAPRVVEVNYSPGFRGLEAATGRDIAQQMIDHVMAQIAPPQPQEKAHETHRF